MANLDLEKTKALNKIRNFSIIAHIDHGKSTLADRIMEFTGAVEKRESKDRMLDTLELEQERGITIKLQTVRMHYKDYVLNLIDTPGHVDFSYEVSRSLAASEGAILLVDATQGIQAQTLTTVYKALEHNLTIIPVINKVDLPSADVDSTKEELIATFGFDPDEIVETSGKTGLGVENLLDMIVKKVPPPEPANNGVTKALIFDSFYDEHKGVVAMVKVMEGEINADENLHTIETKTEIEPIEIGYLLPRMQKDRQIDLGEVGYIATGLKDIKAIHIGDTIVLNSDYQSNKDIDPLPGYHPPKPMVYASLYPIESDEFEELADAIEKLALNDSALTVQRENSPVLGSGFVCGFLGLLHLEITQERLEREFDVSLISTTPTVEYKIKLTTKDYSKIPNLNVANIEGEYLNIRNAAEFPDMSLIEEVKEPWVKLEIITPEEYIGSIMEISQAARGVYKLMEYVTGDETIKGKKHVILKYEIPTGEIIVNYFDKLKSISQGYASMDYEFYEYRTSDIVKVSILVNYLEVEALSFLTHRDNSFAKGKAVVAKLKDIIPRQQFKVPIQSAIGGKVIARETIDAYKKDVTAKLYGGDVTRKKKLLEKQKKGKKRMKMFGKVEIPKEAFLEALKTS
ncbi:elongation factor 4 [Candidatus Dojkabacteria bacterium]|nr:elongation factor 4 [Candidatus Dojkabacteria bacterium]